jgi:hypothetical protein
MMKRLFFVVAATLVAAVVSGCPIYANGQTYRVCTPAACFECPDPSYSAACIPWSCNGSFDCPEGYACSYAGACVSAGSGGLGPCEAGACE